MPPPEPSDASGCCPCGIFTLVPLTLLLLGGIIAAATLGEGTVQLALAACNSEAYPRKALALMSGSSFCAYEIQEGTCHSKSRGSHPCASYSSCVKVPPPNGSFTDALIATGAQSDRAATVQVAVVFAAVFILIAVSCCCGPNLKFLMAGFVPWASIASSINLLVADGPVKGTAAAWAGSGEPLAGACDYNATVTLYSDSELRTASGGVGVAFWLLLVSIPSCACCISCCNSCCCPTDESEVTEGQAAAAEAAEASTHVRSGSTQTTVTVRNAASSAQAAQEARGTAAAVEDVQPRNVWVL